MRQGQHEPACPHDALTQIVGVAYEGPGARIQQAASVGGGALEGRQLAIRRALQQEAGEPDDDAQGQKRGRSRRRRRQDEGQGRAPQPDGDALQQVDLEAAPPQPVGAMALAPMGVGLAFDVDVVAPGLDRQPDRPDAEAEQEQAVEQVQRQAGQGETRPCRRRRGQRIGHVHQPMIALRRPRQPAQGDHGQDPAAAGEPDEQCFTQQGRRRGKGGGEGRQRRGHHDVMPCFSACFRGHDEEPDRYKRHPGESGYHPSVRSHAAVSDHHLHKKTCKHGSLAQASV